MGETWTLPLVERAGFRPAGDRPAGPDAAAPQTADGAVLLPQADVTNAGAAPASGASGRRRSTSLMTASR